MSDFKMEQTNVKCTRCGDTVISPSGKVQITGLPNVIPTIDPEKLKEERKTRCWDCEKEVDIKHPQTGKTPMFVICKDCQHKEEGHKQIYCCECFRECEVERGTRAEKLGMCASCYKGYEGG